MVQLTVSVSLNSNLIARPCLPLQGFETLAWQAASKSQLAVSFLESFSKTIKVKPGLNHEQAFNFSGLKFT